MVLFGGLSGGVSSHLAGGSFGQGFAQGIITAGLNHGMHAGAKEWLYKRATFKAFDAEGEYIGKIKVLKYKLDGNGIEIKLGFTTVSSKYSDYNWVQTVKTNDHIDFGYGNWEYNDPTGSAKDDDSPFYYTKEEMSGVRNIGGHTLEFYDHPSRGSNNFETNWSAELSLVGKIGGSYHEITTLNCNH